MSLNSELGKIMHDIRKQRGLSMRDIHTAGGPTPAFQCDIERGRKSVSVKTLWRWCIAVDTSPVIMIQRLNKRMNSFKGCDND